MFGLRTSHSKLFFGLYKSGEIERQENNWGISTQCKYCAPHGKQAGAACTTKPKSRYNSKPTIVGIWNMSLLGKFNVHRINPRKSLSQMAVLWCLLTRRENDFKVITSKYIDWIALKPWLNGCNMLGATLLDHVATCWAVAGQTRTVQLR